MIWMNCLGHLTRFRGKYTNSDLQLKLQVFSNIKKIFPFFDEFLFFSSACLLTLLVLTSVGWSQVIVILAYANYEKGGCRAQRQAFRKNRHFEFSEQQSSPWPAAQLSGGSICIPNVPDILINNNWISILPCQIFKMLQAVLCFDSWSWDATKLIFRYWLAWSLQFLYMYVSYRIRRPLFLYATKSKSEKAISS